MSRPTCDLFISYHTIQKVDFKASMMLQYTFYIHCNVNLEEEKLTEVAIDHFKMLIQSSTWKTADITVECVVAFAA